MGRCSLQSGQRPCPTTTAADASSCFPCRISTGAYNLARWLAGNTTDAGDVVQKAYLRAYRYFDSFQGSSSLRIA
jgi:hypothetical protein